MHAKNAVIDESCDREAVEAIYEQLPEFDVISPLAYVLKSSTFIVEAINAIN